MGHANLTRYWVKIPPTGTKAFPMFSPSGIEHKWPEYDGPVAEVRFLPFSGQLAADVTARDNKASARDFAPISIVIPKSASLEYFRRGWVTSTPHFYCGNESCRNVFDLPPGADIECPKCLARNQWWCDVCKEIDRHPIFFRTGEARCSICETEIKPDGFVHPRGLIKLINVVTIFGEENHCFHVLRVIHPVFKPVEYRIYENGKCLYRTFTPFVFRGRSRRLYSREIKELV